jgi:hypothetical protein
VSTFGELFEQAEQEIRAPIESAAAEFTDYFVVQGAVLLASRRPNSAAVTCVSCSRLVYSSAMRARRAGWPIPAGIPVWSWSPSGKVIALFRPIRPKRSWHLLKWLANSWLTRVASADPRQLGYEPSGEAACFDLLGRDRVVPHVHCG